MQENNLIQTPVTPVITSQSNFLVILLSILLFISVLIAGFFAYQTQKLVKELRNTAVATIEPTAEPVATSSPSPEPSLTPIASPQPFNSPL